MSKRKTHEQFLKEISKKAKNFLRAQKRDKIKDKYCIEKNINMIRISFKDFKNITNILNEALGRNRYSSIFDE